MRLGNLGDHPCTAARGHVHVDEHDVGDALADHLDCGVDIRRGADDVDDRAELGAHSGQEELMIVDEEHAGRGASQSRRLSDFRERQHQLDLGSLVGR